MSRTLSAPVTVAFDYTRSTGPVLGRFLTGLRDGVVVAGRTSDGQVVVPPPEYDPVTHQALEDFVEVSPIGTVSSWTWVPEPVKHQPFDRPFAYVLVTFDGATKPFLHALDVSSPDEVSTGMRVRVRWAEERVGAITDIACLEPLPAGVLDAGAGRVRVQAVDSPGLVLGIDPADYREWLEGDRLGLNTTSLVVRGEGTLTRTVTNVGRRARYFSTSSAGFERHDVTVTPAALRLGPGESARITVRVARGDGTQEDGAVLLRGGAGTRTRLPLLVTR